MVFARRKNGKIDALYACLQTQAGSSDTPAFPQEELPEDHPEVLAYLNPPAPLDQDVLDAALIAPGSATRAIGLVMFAEINKLRVKNGDPAYTLAQFKAALLAQMR